MPKGTGTYGTTRGRPPTKNNKKSVRKKPRVRSIFEDGALGNLKIPGTNKSTYPESLKAGQSVRRNKPKSPADRVRAAAAAQSRVIRKKPTRKKIKK